MAWEDMPLDPSLTYRWGGEREGKREKKERKDGESFRGRSSSFSLSFLTIGSAVSGGARGKVHPRGKSLASRPELGSFVKLQEVGVFLLLGLILV